MKDEKEKRKIKQFDVKSPDKCPLLSEGAEACNCKEPELGSCPYPYETFPSDCPLRKHIIIIKMEREAAKNNTEEK